MQSTREPKAVPVDDDVLEWFRFSGALISNPVELLEIQSKFAKVLHSHHGGVSVPMLTGGKLVGILNFDPGSAPASYERPAEGA